MICSDGFSNTMGMASIRSNDPITRSLHLKPDDRVQTCSPSCSARGSACCRYSLHQGYEGPCLYLYPGICTKIFPPPTQVFCRKLALLLQGPATLQPGSSLCR